MAPRKKKPDKQPAETPKKKGRPKKAKADKSHYMDKHRAPRPRQSAQDSDLPIPPVTGSYTDELIILALRRAKGLVHVAAGLIGCAPCTIYNRIKEVAEVAQTVRDCRERQVDVAEDKLWKAVDEEQPWAVALVLKGPGKDRGYVERVHQRVGGDADAPPIKEEKYEFTVDDFPLDFRIQLLEQLRQLKARKQGAADATQAAAPPSPDNPEPAGAA